MGQLQKSGDANLPNKIEKLLVEGDLAGLNAEERVTYYNKVCSSLGLNPLTKPFAYIKLNGKLVLYALKDAAEQLRKLHGVSIKITRAEQVGDIFMVTASATDKHGRYDESSGAVPIGHLKGDAKANAFLKCETKAKRRVTLSICGLGMLDETDVEAIPDARPVNEPTADQRRDALFGETTREAERDAQRLEAAGDAPIMDAEEPIPEFMQDGESPLSMAGNTVCKVGRKYKGQRVADIKFDELSGYVQWLKNYAQQQGRELSGDWEEFITAAEYWIQAHHDGEVK